MRRSTVPERWRAGELIFGIGAVALGIGLTAGALAGLTFDRWLLVLIPLAIIGACIYWFRVVAMFPTGVEHSKRTRRRPRDRI